MGENSKEVWYTGVMDSINGDPVNFRTQFYFNEHNQTMITVFDITTEWVRKIQESEYCCATVAMDKGGYLSLFDLFIQEGIQKLSPRGDEKESGITLTLLTTNTIRGRKKFNADSAFSMFQFEVTDGHELIGVCPYDINPGYMDLRRYKAINIPINITPISANTILGDFSFYVVPQEKFNRHTLSLGFRHWIEFKPTHPVLVREFHSMLATITNFLSLLCGEIVTINAVTLIEEIDDQDIRAYDFIGLCNYPRAYLRQLQGNDFDSTRYLRMALFKISDFPDVGKALDYWVKNGNSLKLAHESYGRILLDEDVKFVTKNKFLAAMQLIEGYISAFHDNNNDLEEFNEQKKRIISRLEDKEDKQFVEKQLVPHGRIFRKAVKQFLLEGIKIFKSISNSEFGEKYDELIGNIVNDRDLYTHASSRITQKLNILEIARIASLCKDLYRANILVKCGISNDLIRHRFSHDRAFVAYFENIFGIKLQLSGESSGFDKQMWHYSN